MRISGGTLRGRSLHSPKGDQTRPTSTLVRSAIFNIIGQNLSGSRVLDLFAGGGGLGIEALSRGAEFATFVESHRIALATLRRNLEECKLEEKSLVLPLHVEKAFERLSPRGPFDLIFADPPYACTIAKEPAAEWVLAHLLKTSWVSPGAMLVIESDHALDPAILPPGSPEFQVRQYGGTFLWIAKSPH